MARTSTRNVQRSKPAAPSVAEIVADLPIPLRELIRDLQKVVRAALPTAVADAYGGAKVRLILYSIGDAKNVICGISPCVEDSCLLYLHHIQPADSTLLEIAGKGKHARHVRLQELTRPARAEIRRLLTLAASRARLPQDN